MVSAACTTWRTGKGDPCTRTDRPWPEGMSIRDEDVDRAEGGDTRAPETSAPSASSTVGGTMRRVEGFDGIRGLASILVISYHAGIQFFPRYENWVAVAPWWVARGSYVAVDLFFVLSGYLITTVALSDQARAGGRIPLVRFYSRRVARVYPALIAFLVVHAIYAKSAGYSLGNIAASSTVVLTGLVNYPDVVGPALTDAVGHLWTLSIELQFYLLIPLIITVLPRRRPWLALSVMTVLMVAVATRRHAMYEPGFATLGLLTRTDSHVDGILMGISLAYVLPRLMHLPRQVFAIGGSIGFVGWALLALTNGMDDSRTYQYGFFAAAVFSALMIMSIVVDTGPSAIFRFRPFQVVGTFSYGLYVWHILIFQAVTRWLGDLSAMTQLTIAISTSAAITVISWHLIEKPVLRYVSARSKRAPT